MARFLFRFGFCTPVQWRNLSHGWDDESSEAFFIEAGSEVEAMNWGREVAERFVRFVFQQSDWEQEIPSWKQSNFAHWIESKHEELVSAEVSGTIPLIQAGQTPDFSKWHTN